MDIKELCYELYKLEWMMLHNIDLFRLMNLKKEYYREAQIGSTASFEEFLSENGFNGECYACFNEFLNGEFKNKRIMIALLNDDDLIDEYLKEIYKGLEV